MKPEISNISTVRNCADTIMRHGLKPGGEVAVETKIHIQREGYSVKTENVSRVIYKGQK